MCMSISVEGRCFTVSFTKSPVSISLFISSNDPGPSNQQVLICTGKVFQSNR